MVSATTVGCDHPPPAVEGQGWVEVWEDGFDYASVADLDDEWLIGHFDVATQAAQVQMLPNPDRPGDRMVRLTTGPQYGWTWGNISTLGPAQATEPNYPSARAWHGPLYVEALVRYAEDPWTWPAMWMYSQRKAEVHPAEPADECSSDPPPPQELTAEWDIMENGWHGHTTSQFAAHVHRNTTDNDPDNGRWCGLPDERRRPPEQAVHRLPHKEPLGGWHLWAGHWRADGQLCTYLDDELLRCDPAYDSFMQPLTLNFHIARQNELWWCLLACPPQPSELTMDISHVRVLRPPG